MNIKKILIANRGEIACRIIQTCHKMGIKTVAIHSEIERHAKHVQMADVAFVIKAETPTAAYLDSSAILAIAVENQVDAIHPGYGFLSERAEFAEDIEKAGLIFIGAPIAALQLMGSKAAAKKTMITAGVPCVPGFHGQEQDATYLHKKADEVGYPLLIKASAGGGGKGMKIVNQSSEFIEALNSAKREALKSFGNDHVILERFITNPKHIEVQVFADSQGQAVHLFERDCSSQRRYQKVVEEAPATCISETTKQAMYQAALAATKAVDYQGAGTIEFIVQADEFFFMEMNTRLQVEHRVTEMITDTDLVQWQILVAQGDALPLNQNEIHCKGHAIQSRIYAEDSFNDFLPATGLLEEVQFHQEANTVIDTAVGKSDAISIHFDPMIAKTVCWAENRDKCIEKVLNNLDHTFIVGVKTNLAFLSELISSVEFSNNSVFTNALDNGTLSLKSPSLSPEILATLAHKQYSNHSTNNWSKQDGWSNSGYYNSTFMWRYHDEEVQITGRLLNQHFLTDKQLEIPVYNDAFLFESSQQLQLIHNHHRYLFDKINHQTGSASQDEGNITSPMPGKVLEIKVKVGDKVQQDQTLVVMEAMKMELTLKATHEAIVSKITVNTNDVIAADVVLIELN